MSYNYSDFQTKNPKFSYYLGVILPDLSPSPVEITQNLESVSIVEEAEDLIAGLVTRQIELVINTKELAGVYTKERMLSTGLEYTLRISATASSPANVSNGDLLFNGFSSSASINERLATIKITDKTEQNLHRKFSGTATDLFRFNDTSFFPTAPSNQDASGLSSYRPQTASGDELNNTTACYLVFNKDSDDNPGGITANQMLKAMGVFGGYYNRESSGLADNFYLKKRYWLNPAPDWDIRGLEYYNSFRDLTYQDSLAFNSIDVKGTQFRGRSYPDQYLWELLAFPSTTKARITSSEIMNEEVEANSNNSLFLSNETFENFYFGENPNNLAQKKRPAFLKIFGRDEDTADSNLVQDFYESTTAYNDALSIFQDTRLESEFPIWSTGLKAKVECWVTPFENTESGTYQHIMSTRDGSAGQTITIVRSTRQIGFLDEGTGTSAFTQSNFFTWGEEFHLCVLYDGGSLFFYKNGQQVGNAIAISPATLSTSTGTLKIGWDGVASNSVFYRGLISEIRIMPGFPPASDFVEQTWDIALPEDLVYSQTEDYIQYYWRLNDNVIGIPLPDIRYLDSTNNNNDILPNGVANSITAGFANLRAWNSTGRAFLSSFGSDDFKQAVRLRAYNKSTSTAFLKRAEVLAPANYKVINRFTKNSSNFVEGVEPEKKIDYKSFYINNEAYAQDLADNFISVFANKKGIFNFDITTQPRLMLGDIINFSTLEGDKKGVVLEKNTSISKEGLKDNLTVKVI